jgi:hypothetical protein
MTASKKRLVLAIGIFWAFVAMMLGVAYIVLPSSSVNESNFAAVEIGMTKKDVEFLFRASPVPPGNSINLKALRLSFPIFADNKTRVFHGWEGYDGAAFIGFDQKDRVTSKEWFSEPNYYINRYFR